MFFVYQPTAKQADSVVGRTVPMVLRAEAPVVLSAPVVEVLRLAEAHPQVAVAHPVAAMVRSSADMGRAAEVLAFTVPVVHQSDRFAELHTDRVVPAAAALEAMVQAVAQVAAS